MVGDGFCRLPVPFSRGAAKAARAELGRALTAGQLPQGIVDDAVVVVSELVTNAVRHASPGPDGQVGVEWALDARRLWLRVSDGGRRHGDSSSQGVDPVGGRGLSIVAALSDAWDFERHEAGTTVTAVFYLV